MIRIRTTGGGGWGDPLDRPTADVLRDVLWGKVSRDGAARDYGVVITGSGRRQTRSTTPTSGDLRATRRASADPHRAVLRPRTWLRAGCPADARTPTSTSSECLWISRSSGWCSACAWSGCGSPRGGRGLLGHRPLGGERAARRLEVRPDEPVEQLERVQVTDQQVVGDRVGLLGVVGGLAVRRDDRLIDDVQRAEVGDRVGPTDRVVVPGAALHQPPGRARRATHPSVAMRSAIASTISRTDSTCGSIIWWTAMKCGPTTFQCTCLSVRARSLRASSRLLQDAGDLGALSGRQGRDGETR